MNEFRREVPLVGEHWHVRTRLDRYEPVWHWLIYRESSHAFPSLEAAERFAVGQRERGGVVEIERLVT